MATVNEKYLKDESGNKISPVTSTKSVYLDSKQDSLSNYYVMKRERLTLGLDLSRVPTTGSAPFYLDKSLYGYEAIEFRFKVDSNTGYYVTTISDYVFDIDTWLVCNTLPVDFTNPQYIERQWIIGLSWDYVDGPNLLKIGHAGYKDANASKITAHTLPDGADLKVIGLTYTQ